MERNGDILRRPFGWMHEAIKMAAAIGMLLLPKCSLCLAAYLNLFSIFGISFRSYASWVMPVLLSLLVINLMVAYLKARKMGSYPAFVMLMVGGGLLFMGKVWLLKEALSYAGLLFLATGSVIQLWQSRRICSRSFL
ncbi:hypothetical protein [Dyadobacter pollutisoli]|uniref:MerC domain-containing protein n=1 Tax=Dyadobacter pollutisoli TaxID=2910158 RepID=A0A9E8SLA7_9BACT|nr:hypothetical protein [Dyadobacter pollutisoli]WAC13380.1 hypothetical protein ON006_05335 [Dyadobacter pollutisoli]